MGTKEVRGDRCGSCRFIREDERGRPWTCGQGIREAAPDDERCSLYAAGRPFHSSRVGAVDISDDAKRDLRGALVDLLEKAFTAGMSAASFNNMPWESGQAADEAIKLLRAHGCTACPVVGSLRYFGDLFREFDDEVRGLGVSFGRTLRAIEGTIESVGG